MSLGGLMVVMVISTLLMWGDVADCGAGQEALRACKVYDAMMVKIVTVMLLLSALLGVVVGKVVLKQRYWGG